MNWTFLKGLEQKQSKAAPLLWSGLINIFISANQRKMAQRNIMDDPPR